MRDQATTDSTHKDNTYSQTQHIKTATPPHRHFDRNTACDGTRLQDEQRLENKKKTKKKTVPPG